MLIVIFRYTQLLARFYFVSIFDFDFFPPPAICVRSLVASFQAFGCPTSYPRRPRGRSERIGSCFKRCQLVVGMGGETVVFSFSL